MNKVLLSAVCLGVFSFISSSEAASFNCKFAKLPSEVAICQNGDLHLLDEKMATKYFKLKQVAKKSDWTLILQEQRKWQKRRNKCGYAADCIEDSYVYRMRALDHWLYEYR